ncbi:MAG: hypothetical protein R3E09_17835 [Novosphingobium sp.]
MRILFYLPVVTPWWFDHMIAPMLRALHDDAELHVMVAPLWRNTGIEGHQLAPLADLGRIFWHVIDEGEPDQFRCNGSSVPGLVELVNQIDPELTLARSADFATAKQFPGTVRYIMEGAPPPFEILPMRILVEEVPFSLGVMPEDATETIDRCVTAFADIWEESDRFRHPSVGPDWRGALGLPPERPVLAVPLHYEHRENFFLMHSGFPCAVDLLRHLLETVDQDVFLALSDHPLNKLYVNRAEIHQLVHCNHDRVALCEVEDVPGGATAALAVHADAMLIDQSKSWSLAAHAATPMVRVGNSHLAGWLNAAELDDPAIRNWNGNGLAAPDPVAAHRYFCWHLGTRVFNPNKLNLERLLAHVSGKVPDWIIESNAEILHQQQKEAA